MTNIIKPPLFIIGMPRSGTKLLRDIVLNHPQVVIPDIETEFLPAWYSAYNNKIADWDEFYNYAVKFGYFMHLKGQGKEPISKEKWKQLVHNNEISSAFEQLVKHDTEWQPGQIWGDKSPSYINHVNLIKTLFPSAKIILIVRDVRDYCLSLNHAWNKNPIRAAQRWFDSNSAALKEVKSLEKSGLIIKYEDLIEFPEDTVKKVCTFIDIPFSTDLLLLKKPTENIGGTKGVTTIVKSNSKKWLEKMTNREIEKIESITWPLLGELDYQLQNNHKKLYRISPVKLYLLQVLDFFNLIVSDMKRGQGLLWTIKYHLTSKFR